MDEDENLLVRNIIDDLDEAEELEIRPGRQFRTRVNAFGVSDEQFKKNFRLSKEVVRTLIEDLMPFLNHPTRKSAIDRTTGHGAYQENVEKNLFNMISQGCVSKCIEDVVNALTNEAILDRFIKLPNNIQELRTLRNRFYQKYHFPGVIGIVDGTHVAINTPKDDEHIYVNRKNFHSVNFQVVCDEMLRIININTQSPGSSHDAHVWRQSNISQLLEQIHEHYDEPFYVLSDSGYHLRPWLLHAIENPPIVSPEERFSNHLRNVRSSVERCIGLLKNRFRCLLHYRTLHYSPYKASKIITACAVLHNLCINNNIDLEDDEQYNDDLQVNINLDFEEEEAEINAINPMLAEARR